MSTTHIEDQLESFLKEGSDTLVLYRHQNSKIKHLLLGNSFELNDGISDSTLLKSGFVMQPFVSTKHPAFFVEKVFTEEFSNDLSKETLAIIGNFCEKLIRDEEDNETGLDDYLEQFDRMHLAIKETKVKKAILSRIKKVQALKSGLILKLFDTLCEFYPHAFNYVIASPVSGLWIGAGPEVLLKKEDDVLNTVSLAGTLPNAPEEEWSEKEIVEQALVTDYMEDKLRNNGVIKYQRNGPYSAEAGQVKHLRTDFAFQVNDLKDNIAHLLSQLHPTPAVCGMPKANAVELIEQCEVHDRAYYAGFLGPVDNGTFTLYVNIRCMKLCKQYSALYLGGGLTAASVAKKEWEETNMKAETLLSVIKNVANLQAYE